MPQHTPFAARLRTVLLATTGLVAAGCNTISDQSATADPSDSKPVAVASKATEEHSTKGLTFESMMRVADRAWQKNDAPTALRLYATAARKQPENPAPLIIIGEILRKTGRPGDAVGIYDRVLSIDATNLEAHHGKGYSYLQMEKPYMASQAFARALELDNNDAKSLGGLAVAYDKAGEHDKAQGYYKAAIKADPENLNYKSNLALSLALSGETEQAIALLKVVTNDPRATAKHRQTLALAYGLAGQSGEAMKYSRMDLSEKEARNNALYFEALNSKADEQVASLDDQIKLMKASKDDVVSESRVVADAPREPANPDVLMARTETEHLSTNAEANKKAAPAPAEPKRLVPTPTAPMMMAKAEPAEPKSALVKSVAPVVVAKKDAPMEIEAPVTVAKKEIEAPATVAKKEIEAPAPVAKADEDGGDKPVTFVKKDSGQPLENPAVAVKTESAPTESAPEEKPVSVAKTEEAPAPAREWKMEEKPAPAAKPAPMIAETPEDEPVAKKIGLVPGDMPINGDVSEKKEETPIVTASLVEAYRPDGGDYFLQIGSYKEKAAAEKGWRIVQSQNVDLLGGIEPVIQEIDLGDDNGGLYYRLQIGGFTDKTRTMQLCGSLRDRSFDCFMPMTPKSATPVKKEAPTLAPNQRMVDGGDPKTRNDSDLIADFKEDLGAL